jgi:hypothetical protein
MAFHQFQTAVRHARFVYSPYTDEADWKAIDVSHGPDCPKNLLEEAMSTPDGVLVRRCFRILTAKSMGVTITLADVTEEEFRCWN